MKIKYIIKGTVTVGVVLAMLTLSACGNTANTDATQETTEVTTEYVDDMDIQTPELVANAETIAAYGQLLNNACVYLNENYADKIAGDVRKEYDETAARLHDINLQGMSVMAEKSDEERNEVFDELEEIEKSLFDSVAEQIGVKAELTEAVTTTADRYSKPSGVITSDEESEISSEDTTSEDTSAEAETEGERLTSDN
jgi:hypothetical protein